MALLTLIDGSKTYIAAAGLLGLAVYQASQGDVGTAFHTGFHALAIAGIRNAITKAIE